MSAEVQPLPEKEAKQILQLPPEVMANADKVTPIAAVFTYSLTTPKRIFERTMVLEPGQEMDLIDICLARKMEATNGGRPAASPGMDTYLGGRFDTSNYYEAAVQAAQKDASIAILPFRPEEPPSEITHLTPSDSFEIQVIYPDGRTNNLRIFPILFPAVHPRTHNVMHPRREKRKIDHVEIVSLSHFVHEVETGDREGAKLIGGFVLNPNYNDPNFRINLDEDMRRREVITKLLGTLHEQHYKTKADFHHRLTLLLKIAGVQLPEDFVDLVRVEDVLLYMRENLPEAQFRQIVDTAYSQITAEEYMRVYRQKEKDHAKKAITKAAEVRASTGPVVQQHTLLNLDEYTVKADITDVEPEYAQLEFWGKEKALSRLKHRIERYTHTVRESTFDINLGADIDMMLPLIVQSREFVSGKSTRAVAAASKLFRSVLDYALIDSAGFVENDQRFSDRVAGVSAYFKANERDTVKIKRYLDKLDASIFGLFGEITGLSQSDLRRIWHRALVTSYQMIDEASQDGSTTTDLHQLPNEIRRAGPGRCFLLAFGVDRVDHGPEGWRRLSYEALTQNFADILAIMQTPIYERRAYAVNHPLALFADWYFGPAQEHIDPYQDPETGNTFHRKTLVRTFTRKDGTQIPVIVDEKTGKWYPSFARKAKMEPVGKIDDYDSINIVIPDKITLPNGEVVTQPMTPEERILLIREIMEDMEASMKEQFNGKGWELNVRQDRKKDTLVNYGHYMAGEPLEEVEKREGSISHRIIRLKRYFQVTDPETGESYSIEFAGYPLEDSRRIDPSGNLLGFIQKRIDDVLFRARRLLARSDKILGQPSIYERRFSPAIKVFARVAEQTMYKETA